MVGNIFPAILLFLVIFHLTDQILFLCYPSQLDPNALSNGAAPEIGYYLANNLESNPWMKNCPAEQEENWHGIYIDVDGDIVNLTLSFSTQSFTINQRNFILDLANSSYSSITTKLLIFNDASKQYEIKEIEQIRQEFLNNQNKGASLADFAGLWSLALDMLPSNLHQNKIKIFTLASKENRHPEHHNEDICDVDSGNMVKDNCSVQAWFLQPDDKIIAQNQIAVNTNNNSCLMDMKLPFTDESLLEYPLKMSDTIHITGRLMNDNFIGYFRIHLLHNWKEPDSIMGETILTILVRRNYINFESKYNFTKYEPDSKETILDKIRQNLTDIDKKFSLNIHADSNGNYMIILNCKNESAFVFTQAIDNPLKYTSTNFPIWIWTDNKTIHQSDIVHSLTEEVNVKQFLFRFVQINGNDLIYINYDEIGQMETMGKPNYIQFKGGLLLLNLTVETIPIFKEYPLENAFKQFNQISLLIMKFDSESGFQIYFRCLDEQKCEKSLNISMKLYINDFYMELSYYSKKSELEFVQEEKIYQGIEFPEKEKLHLDIYANQFEYQIFLNAELILMANYWQFPTPDKFDTIITEGLVFLPKGKLRKEWKQLNEDIALPFSYQLDKPLEIESSIRIKIDFRDNLKMSIYFQNDAPEFNEHFGTNVLWLNIYASRVDLYIFIYYGKNEDSNFQNFTKEPFENYQFGDKLEFEIIVHERYYEIIIDKKDWFAISHILPFEMVDFMRIENRENNTETHGEIIEAKIIWPSDNSSKWLTSPGKKQFELIGPLGIPTGESGSLIMRLNRPLRINDAIMFKGKFHNGLKEYRDLYIELLRNTTKNETFLILKANLDYKPKSGPYSGDSRIYSLYTNKFDEQGNVVSGASLRKKVLFDQSNDEFDVKIRIGVDNKFYVQNGNSKEANITSDGLFWAVQYIKFRFGRNGLETKQNVELDNGYPKIVHEYEKDD